MMHRHTEQPFLKNVDTLRIRVYFVRLWFIDYNFCGWIRIISCVSLNTCFFHESGKVELQTLRLSESAATPFHEIGHGTTPFELRGDTKSACSIDVAVCLSCLYGA